jgi:hypothetical protein
MRSFSRKEIEDKLVELGGIVKENTIVSQGWKVTILEEKEVKFGKISLNSILLEINIFKDIEKDFMNKFRIKFSRGGG